MTALPTPRFDLTALTLYLVTDTALAAGPGGSRRVPDVVAAAVAGGVTCVQVREKHATGREYLALVTAVAERVGDRVPVLVNDRVDVFLAARDAGAAVAGVHVGQDDLPVTAVRRLIGPDAVLGLSASTADELDVVATLPVGTVDYLGIGAVHATATKPDAPAPLGVDGFGRAVARLSAGSGLPAVAIGGISTDDAAALRDAGAAGLAVVSAICAAPDPEAAARQLRAAFESRPAAGGTR
ncbi:thiamine-phosphate synthase [Tersicoccus solisilvae]|uniref:Thiamine-phosphate synthase n=1 Tax=Tersicoccus solisilvae TaxID=1882339 RepID=A0ABQ1NUN6_9MICC|nr:thiamine phosphate synthase [Tersicoccus solisilvae]GGC85066.1 thiamine-phosphate synthase [Tersicoccus solisilvae]